MNEQSRRICLFGGSFDPPHVAHVMATAWALATLRVEAVWWVPTWQHAFGKNLSSFEQRLELCQLAIQPFGACVKVSNIEEQLGGESRTIDTIEALSARFPDTTWLLLLGSDIIPQTRQWKQWDRVQQLAEVVVIGRAGHGDVDPSLDVVLPNIASSSVRRALAQSDEAWLRQRVPAAVLDQIARDGLYR